MGYLRDGFEIRDIVPRIPNGLEIDRLGLVVNGSSNIFRLVSLHELGRDSQPREHHLELIVRAAIQIAGRDNIVTGMREGRDGHELRGLARGCGNGGNTALQGCDALFKDIYCRVHYATIDVAELFEAEEPGAVGRVIEDIGTRGINGDCPGVGGGIGLMASLVQI